jgi:hypothetical protein
MEPRGSGIYSGEVKLASIQPGDRERRESVFDQE